jgi:hypothetical protein
MDGVLRMPQSPGGWCREVVETLLLAYLVSDPNLSLGGGL